MCPEFFFVNEDNIFFCITQNCFRSLKMLGLCWQMSGFGLKIFHCTWRKYHLFIKWHQHFWIAKHFWRVSENIQRESGNFDCKWRLCYFLSYLTQISRLLKVSCVCPEIYSVCLKFPDWYKFLECVQKFPVCVQ